jgi:hypothetical protein
MPKKTAKPVPSFADTVKKMFGKGGESFLGSGLAKRAATAKKKRKARLDKALKKQGAQ